ncbi:MAG: LpxD N-terminal domain-containing protein, partial [Thermodesulfobacteriota bacterium]
MPTFSLAEIASRVNGKVIGDPSISITGVATLRDAAEGEISFLSNLKYYSQFKRTAASAVIVPESVKNGSTNLVVVDNPYQSVLQVMNVFYPQKEDHTCGIHP